MKKHSVIIFLIMTSIFLLSGCSSIKTQMIDSIEEKVETKSGVHEDEHYKQYEDLAESGQIDINTGCVVGSYCEQEYLVDISSENNNGTVHVTLARNNHLSVDYYLHENNQNRVEGECWLNPGDSLYYSYPNVENVNTNLYRFDHFDVYEYNPNRVKSSQIITKPTEGIVFTIPADFKVTELSVEPIGVYEERDLSLNDYYIDSDGNKHDLTGVWNINGTETKEKTISISPTVDCKVSYQYDQNRYYLGTSDPGYFSNPDGTVYFNVSSPNENINSYSVEVKEYINVAFEGTIKGILSTKVNGIEQALNKNALQGIRCGDRIQVEVKQKYSAGSNDMVTESKESGKYTFVVPETDLLNLSIIITGDNNGFETPTIANGKVIVSYANKDGDTPISDGTVIAGNTKVKIRIQPDDGYYVSGKKVNSDGEYEQTMNYSDYIKKIGDICSDHAIKKIVTIYLETVDPYGTVKYTVGGKEIQSPYTIKSGEKIKLNYSITDKDYKIVHDGNIVGSTFNNTFGIASCTKEIVIDEAMDGTTISREDYINVERKKGN